MMKLTEITQQFGQNHLFLKLAYLHGSHAHFCATPLSDVDIALVVDSSHLLKSAWDFEIELEMMFQNQFKTLDFDVRVMNDAPLDFQGKVITEGKILFVPDKIFKADYEERTRRLYFDFKPFIDQYCKERLDTIRREGLTHG